MLLFFFSFRFTSVSGSVCVRVISTSGAFSPYAAAVAVGLWPLCAPCEDSIRTKQPLKRLREERNSHKALLILLACLLAGLQLLPPWWVKAMQMMSGCKSWNQYIYMSLFFYSVCAECSRITLPEVNLHWSSIADIDILNTAFIHAFLIQMYVLFMYCIFMFEKWNDLCTVHGFFFRVEVFYNWFLNFLINLKIKHFGWRI